MPDPESRCGQAEGGEEVARELVVAGGDCAEVFEFVEEALDEVALAVEGGIDRSADAHIALCWDVGPGAALFDEFDQGAGGAGAVGNHVSGQGQPPEQLRGRGLVRGLAGGQDEPHRQAAVIHDDMDFGAQSSPGAADGVIRTPFFPPAAC